ncbi:caspase domain-containing protein [Armillaria nabsnona]|nr:caspase domain-containing protein [Armillaria nabsnona]
MAMTISDFNPVPCFAYSERSIFVEFMLVCFFIGFPFFPPNRAESMVISLLALDSYLKTTNRLYDFKPRCEAYGAYEVPWAQTFQTRSTKKELNALEESIKPMVQHEIRLAQLYGIAVDSDEVYEETKSRGDAESLRTLSTLRTRRTKIAAMQRFLSQASRGVPQPSTAASRNTSFPTKFEIDASRTWAVLIGVDAYVVNPEYSLRGCVSDALAMKKYLTNDLMVPEDHIQVLLSPNPECKPPNSVADVLVSLIINTIRLLYPDCLTITSRTLPTRDNIIRALVDVSRDPRIKEGDHIILFFSGHGTNYPCEIYFNDDIGEQGNIEALCPVDRGYRDAKGYIIPDISDREIHVILKEICRVKGHRITVVLDCCYSGSMTRVPVAAGETCRAVDALDGSPSKNMLDAAVSLEKSVTGSVSVLSPKWRPDMTSHVAVAACKEYELAKEIKGKDGRSTGVFTTALLDTLRFGKLTSTSTYIDLVDALPAESFQTPVVAGQYKNERIWFRQ